jgi:hypothetical protein
MEAATRGHWRRWAVLAVAGLAVAVAAVVVGVAVADDDEQPDSAGQVANVQQACQRWMDSGGPAGERGWCTDMTGWMGDQMGRTGMSPQMVWGDANRMLGSCRQWVTESRPADAVEAEAWCDDMIEWMTDHIADWPGWMMDGGMMDG